MKETLTIICVKVFGDWNEVVEYSSKTGYLMLECGLYIRLEKVEEIKTISFELPINEKDLCKSKSQESGRLKPTSRPKP
jgi:hypothetical protein